MDDSSQKFKSGQKASISKRITLEDIELFAKISGDENPIHMNEDIASKSRFKRRIAHGLLTAGLISAVLGMELPGPGGIYLHQELKFLSPVYPDDKITAEVEVMSWDPDKAIIELDTRCVNQNGKQVLSGRAVLLVESL